MSNSNRSEQYWMILRVTLTVITCVAILVASAWAVVIINQTEPTAQTINSTRKSAALVETIRVQRGTFTPELQVLGNVQSAQEIQLSPRISGQVNAISTSFVPGGMVRKGDVLLQLDAADFENALSISQSELQQAEASLQIEKGRQSLAKKELALLEGTIDETNRALVLREPQIESIVAEVNAAKAAVQRAELNLQRTSIVAPFDAQIISRSVNVGSQVSPGDNLARLVGMQEYWIMASLPVRHLQWLQFPDRDGYGSSVVLRDSDTWGPGIQRPAVVTKMIGTLDQQTRLARVLIVVPDPLGRQSRLPPLILDTLIECHIQCRPIQNVVKLSRQYVHDNDTVWVMVDGKLDIRQVSVSFRDAQFAYIQSGLESGDSVVTTNLATVAPGIGLKRVNESDPVMPEVSAQ